MNEVQLNNRESMISTMVENLPLLRTKLNLSQQEFADIIGIGRQTLSTIENKKSKMRWDTFLAIILVISKTPSAEEVMKLIGLDLADISIILATETNRSANMNDSIFEKLWTDDKEKKYTLRGTVPVPVGLRNCRCPKCDSINIRGALITETADEQDPNIICLDCGYWWD